MDDGEHKPSGHPTSTLPVNSDHKATKFRPFTLSPPHMLAFHLSWLSLFSCFFSTFSIPPLLPVIRRDINLTAADVSRAGAASFAGAIFSRLAMGPACDVLGPRIASAAFSLLTAPAVLATAFLTGHISFIVIRFLIGFSLANFVACQFWMSSMFSNDVVGIANGFAAGWANVGSGFTQLVMPLIYSFFINTLNLPSSVSWRLSFLFPAIFQTATALIVLVYGPDLPDIGSYKRTAKRNGENRPKENVFMIIFQGMKNYRAWILGLVYGFCFGVELTIDNIIAQYFYERFSLDIETAGAIAASFGFANVVSRPLGGVVSDGMGRRFGMRGRLWSLWVAMVVAGWLCFWLGRVSTLWGSVIVMCLFSFFVQAASGLTFGVVPFVSKRSLGVVSGMTGSGGTIGAVITQLLLFPGSNNMSTQTSISLMGLMMVLSSLSITLLYFPNSGGMFCGPNSKQNDPPQQEEDYQLLQ